jgi:hypothetical protein
MNRGGRLQYFRGAILKQRKGENAGDGGTRVVVEHFYAVLGAGVAVAAGIEEGAVLVGVAREGAMRFARDAAFDVRERAIEPNGDAVVGDQFEILVGMKGAAAE